MEGFIFLIIVIAVISAAAQIGLPLLVGIFAYRAARNYGVQLEREMQLFQQQLRSNSTGAGPELMARWARMSNLVDSMNVQDQRRYEESMSSMKAYAAQNGLFLD